MQDFGTKTDNTAGPGGQLSAAEFNNLASENKNAVLRSGLALDAGSTLQIAGGMFLNAVKARSFQDSGVADAYVATPVSGSSGVFLPANYTPLDGAVIGFSAAATNTGASTLNIGQTTGTLLGTKKIFSAAGIALTAGAIVAGTFIEVRFNQALDSGAGAWVLLPWSTFTGQVYPPEHLSGFTLSNNGVAPTTTVDVASGSARNLLNTLDINLSASMSGILQTSGAWAAGTGQNKLDTGARAANSTYWVFVIRKTSDGTGDILFSLSPTAPIMPSGYAGFRRTHAVLTDAGNMIKAFINDPTNPDEVTFTTPLADISATGVGSGTVNYAISVPVGMAVQAIVQGSVQTSAGAAFYHINTPGNNDVSGNLYATAVTTAANVAATFGRVYIRTNASAQIQVNSQLASNTHRFAAYGWVDRRGV